MAGTIIQTPKTRARNPLAAFTLSLCATGLGQMYNGSLGAGIAFCLLRSLAILSFPLYVVSHRPASSLLAFIMLMGALLLVTVASPVEALMRARRGSELPVRPYSSIPWYGIFAVMCVILTAASVLIASSFFYIERVGGGRTGPVLEEGERILVMTYLPEGLRRGEMASLAGGQARVMAIQGDRVRYEKNIFYVNGNALVMGYLPDRVIARFSGEREDIISEVNDAGSYPICFKQSADITAGRVPPVVPAGHLLTVLDDRREKDFARVVSTGEVRGRVEGVLFSGRFRKIGMNARGNLG
ncbi:MAG: hypothetical protein JW838_15460, partial [Spirochaetes bacterium]|nr:hypothetical protein [Spirochaetota bacterium]